MLNWMLSIAIIVGLTSCAESLTPPQIKARIKIESKMYQRSNKRPVVLDRKKDLLWQDDSAAKDKQLSFSSAKGYCSSLNLASYSDWRLPTISELVSITTPYEKDVRIVPAFKNTKASVYWSSKVIQKAEPYILLVNFNNAKSYEEELSTFTTYNVRCVRDAQDLLRKK